MLIPHMGTIFTNSQNCDHFRNKKDVDSHSTPKALGGNLKIVLSVAEWIKQSSFAIKILIHIDIKQIQFSGIIESNRERSRKKHK